MSCAPKVLHIRVEYTSNDALCGRRIPYDTPMLCEPIAKHWIGKVQPPCSQCLKVAMKNLAVA